jgi:DNA invertase Pin-like site-specific DNA recombinase
MARTSRKNRPDEIEAPKIIIYDTWGYTRISVDGERSEDSIENQTAIIKDFVSDKPDLHLRGVISDLGFTGRDFDRPGYAELLEGIKRGDVGCVVVKDLSRVGRTYIETVELLFDVFPAYNVRFISVNEKYDSFADDAARMKLLILVKSLLNQMYSNDLGKKIRSAHDAKKRRGELSGMPPYGYKRGNDGITLAFDGDAAEIVKRVFDMRLQGMSVCGIAKHLIAQGIPSPQKRRYQMGKVTHEKFSGRIVWNAGMVSKMLQNETYTGTLVQGKYNCDGKRHTMLPKDQWIRHEGKHPAIIGREQFDAVQELMKETAAKYTHRKRGALPENKYSGKIFCSRCGKAVTRAPGGSKNLLFYYYCRQCDNDIKAEQGLTKISKLSQATLDAAVLGTLRNQIKILLDFERLSGKLAASDTHGQRRAALKRDLARWEKIFNNADRKLSAAYTHYLDGILGSREFTLIRTEIEADKKEAGAKAERAKSDLRKYGEMAARHEYWRKAYADFTAAGETSRELIQLLVNRIQLTPITNELHIIMNYRDELEEYRGLLTGSAVDTDA